MSRRDGRAVSTPPPPPRPAGLSRRGLLLGAGAAAALSLRLPVRAAVGPAPARAPADAWLAFFDKVALRRRREDGSDAPGWVRKWTGPVAVRVFGGVGRQAGPALADALAIVSRETGLAFRLVASARTPSGRRLDIRYLDHETMVARYGGAVGNCMTWGNGGRLHTGLIEISVRYPDCLHHELMHGLGFDNHWTGPRATAALPSVLAHRFTPARVDRFSALDRAAIRTLYDPRLAPGTPRAQALVVARALVGEAALA